MKQTALTLARSALRATESSAPFASPMCVPAAEMSAASLRPYSAVTTPRDGGEDDICRPMPGSVATPPAACGVSDGVVACMNGSYNIHVYERDMVHEFGVNACPARTQGN
eukprot:3528746-Prymnesium_polylepis.1